MASISRCIYRSGFIAGGAFKTTGAVVHSHQWNAARLMSSKAGGAGSKVKMALKGIGIGLTGSVAIASYFSFKPKDQHFQFTPVEVYVVDHKPDVPIARKIVNENDKSGLDLVLFQYQTCPFCCKVRAFLDYSGLTYSVVEVDSVLRQSLKWSPYKKVPSLLARRKDGTYIQLTESSRIISVLSAYLLDPDLTIDTAVTYYPNLKIEDKSGHKKPDVINKYNRLNDNKVTTHYTKEWEANERKWRMWVDEHFIHLISPNVYRTYSEALETFNWFSEAGEWDRLFPSWERNLMVGVGATVMYFIGKRLKKRHGISKDVREDMYLACKTWTKELKKNNTPFMGGSTPNLADLAFFGALTCMEGCRTFDDIRSNTDLDTWFEPMKKLVHANKGTVIHPVDVA